LSRSLDSLNFGFAQFRPDTGPYICGPEELTAPHTNGPTKPYRKAAEQGNADSQFNLGFMYKNGNGVIQDAVIAHMWFNISAASGDAGSSEQRSIIEQRMTHEQIAEAQAFARRCMASDYRDCN
jgi:hypothetical protein